MSDIEKIFTSDFRNCLRFTRRACFASRGNILADFPAEISRSFSRAAERSPLRSPEIYRCTWRDVIDTIRHSEESGLGRRDGESISSIKTRHSTKIHSTRRSSLSPPYLLCNTKYILGIENLHSPFARRRYIDSFPRGTNTPRCAETWSFFGHVAFHSIGRTVDG